jgi:hypothetical protein
MSRPDQREAADRDVEADHHSIDEPRVARCGLCHVPLPQQRRGRWISLAFGQDSWWARNILAAGECLLRYRATDCHLVEPVVVDASSVRSELPLLMRFGLPLMGVHKILRMRSMPKP